MLVDLGRNDLGRVCEYGTVEVETFMAVETYSHVMHIVSSVAGDLRPEVEPVDALRSVLPAGTLSGAPKVRAMQIIDELEPVKRGGYGGAVGYLSYTGDLDTCIHIRTVVVTDGMAHVQAGGGTVADAKPDYEYEESVAKARGVLQAIELARGAGGLGVKVLVVDNYDSFTYNLVQYLGELGAELDVVRNDRATVDELLEQGAERLVVSPGPCTPNEAGISVDAMRRFPEAGSPRSECAWATSRSPRPSAGRSSATSPCTARARSWSTTAGRSSPASKARSPWAATTRSSWTPTCPTASSARPRAAGS